MILFDRYAELNVADAWTGDRNPIAYTDLATLGINPDELEWKDFEPARASAEGAANTPAAVIDHARMLVANAFSVSPDAVKITVSL